MTFPVSESHPSGLDAPTLAHAFLRTARHYADRPALALLGDDAVMTWRDYEQKVRSLAAGLAGLGLRAGQPLAMLLNTRPEFHWFDTAAICLGAVPFSIYPTAAPDQVGYQLRDADARVLVTERALLQTARTAAHQSGVTTVIVVDGTADEGLTVADVEAVGRDDYVLNPDTVQPDDLLTLIYTSGTTGTPKGVQITHANMLYILRTFYDLVQFPTVGHVIAWLPMAHVAERACGHYLPMMTGFSSTSCPDNRLVGAALQQVRPTWFFAVPRIWEKLKDAIEERIASQPEEQQAQLKWALDIGARRVRAVQSGDTIPADLEDLYRQADDAVLSNLRAAFGLDRLYAVHVGGAPTARPVVEFWHALGVPVSELWGMSETAGPSTLNPPHRIKIGSVGRAIPGTEVRLGPDNEVYVRGPGVMTGYRNLPDETKHALDGDGWLHTGDIGELDAEGYLTIIDRKKELIISAGGKNMSPSYIEAKLKTADPLIGQAVTIGDRRKHNVALITLDPDTAVKFAADRGWAGLSIAELSTNAAVYERIRRGVAAANEQLARVEQVKKFTILPVTWEPGSDELTPTLKLRRKSIDRKYADYIEQLYTGDSPATTDGDSPDIEERS